MSESVAAVAAPAVPQAPAGSAGVTYLIALVCGLAAFMEVLDTAIANVSLVHIAGSLAASTEEATWVLTSYLVANAIVLPMTGWLSDTLGRKRYYLGCMAAFTLSSLLCGLAPSLPVLVALRVIQGMAGAGLQPVSQAILNDSFPPAQRGAALAVYGMAVIAAPAIGPTLGGWLTDNFSWHWIFLINVPIGLLLGSLAGALIHDPPELVAATRARREANRGIDYLGFGLIAVGMGTLQLTLDLGQKHDWLESDLIVGCILVSVISIAWLIWRELHHEHPIINLRLLGERNFAIGNLLLTGMSMPLLGLTLLLPQFMQTLMGYSALDAGIVMSPGALVTFVMMPIVGRLVMKFDARLLASLGFVGVSAAMLQLTTIDLSISQTQLTLLRLLQMLALSFVFIPINTIAFAGMPPGHTSSATAITALTRNLGGSIGISLVTFVLARASQQHHQQFIGHVNPLEPAYQGMVQTLTSSLGSLQAAQASIAGMVARQSTLLAFLDTFLLLSGLTFLLAVLVWLTRRPAHVSEAATGGH